MATAHVASDSWHCLCVESYCQVYPQPLQCALHLFSSPDDSGFYAASTGASDHEEEWFGVLSCLCFHYMFHFILTCYLVYAFIIILCFILFLCVILLTWRELQKKNKQEFLEILSQPVKLYKKGKGKHPKRLSSKKRSTETTGTWGTTRTTGKPRIGGTEEPKEAVEPEEQKELE